ncbi:myosin heavy chain [Forsythia ovata]|uniref:Myosin heavy chain n=1 Tax=Forsythia ovata TaxID=205694 RepID=A0ABD1TPD3_9LAMI
MFKLQRHNDNKITNSREKIDFKFSNFQALQVPKGWDKLFVSLISVETGKTVAKLGKALVQNGTCQWSETLLESIWLSRNDSSREYEECLFKLVVSMGTARSGILGEATINMAHYISSRVSAAVSQPLKNCNHGTVLQFKIHCLTPRPKARDDESKCSNASEKDMSSKSNRSDISSDSTFGHQDLGTTSYPVKLDSEETSHTASESNRSFDSAEGSIAKENSSSRSKKCNSHGRPVGSSLENSPPDNYFLDDHSPSNQSSFNSRLHLRADLHNETEVTRSSFTDVNTSKDLLVAAEDAIEELLAEAKMWERNARKLMLDLDLSRKEIANLSKRQAELEIKLSASYAECDGLRRDREELKLLFEESTMKQATLSDSTTKPASLVQIQKELENEIKYQQESNANLAQQLKRSQESNIELVSLLQELEETIEQQKVEIENLSSLKFDFKEIESSIAKYSQENKSLLLQLQQLQESEKTLQVNVQLLEKALRDKTDEMENERNLNGQYLLHAEKEYKYKLSVKEEEIARLEEKISNFIPRGHSKDVDHNNENYMNLTGEIEALKEKFQELEKDCDELTDENLDLVLKLKESDKSNIRNCGSYSDESEVIDPKCQMSQLEEELEKKVAEEVQLVSFETSKHFTDILEQFKMAFHHLNKPWDNISSDESEKCDYFLQDLIMSASKGNTTTMKSPAEYIVSSLLELNKILEQRIAKYTEILQHREVEIGQRSTLFAETQEELENCILELQKHENLKATVEESYSNLVKELTQKSCEVENLEADLLSKEENTNFLLQQLSELEAQVADLQQTNSHLEKNVELVLSESNVTSECLENLKNDLIVLQNTASSHVSANKMLERKLEELELEKHKLEKKLLELQEENLQLQEYISGLESQISRLKDEKESCQLELDNSKSVAIGLQDEIRNLKLEMDIYISDLKQKCEDMQKHWLEAQAECQNLKTENQKLQASSETLLGESMKLKNSNSELNRENLELHEHCSEMVSQLRASKNSLSDCSKNVKSLEDHLTSMLEDFSARENKNLKEKLSLVESLRQTFLEKTTELGSLQKEVEHLTRQIYDAHKERERISFETQGEISILLADKAKLESSLQEVQLKAELTKKELDAVQAESQLKFQGLKGELAASLRSYETLMAENEKMLKLLGSYRKSEERLKTEMNDLELKLTVSDYERQQLTKEISCLKVQLMNVPELQDEVSVLKSKLMECASAKGKLELTLQTVSRDYEELKAEKITFSEKVSRLQKAMSDFEECKMEKIALEEKLLQMESALIANETLCIENADLRNEVSEIKKENIHFQQKIHQLEEEKDECLEKARALEGDLKLMEEEIQPHRRRNGTLKRTSQAQTSPEQEHQENERSTHESQYQREGYNGLDGHDENLHAISMDHLSKIQCLENELSEALDANNKYKIQLHRFMSMGQNNHTTASKQSEVSGEVVTRQSNERTKSSLETELRDLRERYLQMSLKYAEVEAQREDLVMKLKETKGGKRNTYWLHISTDN